jgi:hypothetical protein
MAKNYLQEMIEKEEEEFNKVRSYIADNFDRRLTITDVVHETKVDRKLISKWLKEERLHLGKPPRNIENSHPNISNTEKSIIKNKKVHRRF